jgi:DNA-directed RNA polymerase specialized sigma24 family protein
MGRQRPAGTLGHRGADDDSELVSRAQTGDRLAFEELVRRHADRLHAVVTRLVADRHEAEEVTQEAFLRAWRGIATFKGEAHFFTWLYRIGVNEARRRRVARCARNRARGPAPGPRPPRRAPRPARGARARRAGAGP